MPRAASRAALGIDDDATVVALLPGSRRSEIQYIAPRLLRRGSGDEPGSGPALRFVLPVVTGLRHAIEPLRKQYAPDAPITLLDGRAHEALAACDVALVASGTATLETALFKRPMVVVYVMHALTWQMGKRMNYLPWVALPNILLREFAVPELLQADATAGRSPPPRSSGSTIPMPQNRCASASKASIATCSATPAPSRRPRSKRSSITETASMHARTFLRAHQLRSIVDVEGLMAGVDEVGRGPLAGPVVAAAVILDEGRTIRGLNDSKLLAAEERERLDVEIRRKAICFSVACGERRRDRLASTSCARRCWRCGAPSKAWRSSRRSSSSTATSGRS